MVRPWKMDINENVPPLVHCETVTKYSAIFSANFSECFAEFMQ